MKIQVCSDLHIEFGEVPTLTPGADVLILGGDICLADHFTKSPESPYFKYQKKYFDFFAHCAETFPHVLYIAGNHEHYHGRFDKTIPTLKAALGDLVTVLDKESVEIDGVKFIGGTMWTNANGNNPITVSDVENCLNDYKIVSIFDGTHYRKLRMYDTMKEFEQTLKFIHQESQGHDKCVVLTHHGPTPLSIGEAYKDAYHLNGGYVSNLVDFIHDHPQIKLWTHGHVHAPFEYKVGETLVACNPKGYPGENVAFNPSYILEV